MLHYVARLEDLQVINCRVITCITSITTKVAVKLASAFNNPPVNGK